MMRKNIFYQLGRAVLFGITMFAVFVLTPEGSLSARAQDEPEMPSNDTRILPATVKSRQTMVERYFALAPVPSYAPGYYDTSVYMLGDVAVGIVLPESAGGAENWTTTEKNDVVNEIQTGLNWWKTTGGTLANLTFEYDLQLGVPTTYEPISRPSSDDALWIDQVMSNLGYTSGDYWDKVYAYNNALRNQYQTDWAFTIFVVDSSVDIDGMFADGYFAYAYMGGPFMVMTYDNDGWGIDAMDKITAHETGHIFMAGDQYGSCSTTRKYGYLGIVNGNCNGNPSIMKDNSWAVDTFAKGQIGWKDSDSDNIPDVLDTTPVVTLASYAPNPTLNTTLSYSGYVKSPAYPHAICGTGDWCYSKDVTIQSINKVNYQVDNGTSNSAIAQDGAFDSDVEDFSFATSPLSSGSHSIKLTASNLSGNVSPTWNDSVTVKVPAQAVGFGTYDDADSNWIFGGNWTFANTTGPYAGTLHYSTTVGSSAEISFNGPAKFKLTYSGYPTRGFLNIYVDGTLVHSLYQYDPGLVWQKTWTSVTYPTGTHTVRLVHASGVSADVDAITFYAPDSTPPGAITNLSAATGASNGSVNLTWNAPGDDGSTGTATSYLVRYSSSAISNQTAWDSATVFVNALVPQVAGSTENLTVDGLTPGQTYYFSVRAQDEELNLGGLSNSDASAVAKVGGIYDDANSAWTYTQQNYWTAVTNTTGPYANTLHYSTTVGNSAQVSFSGPGRFKLYYTGYSTRGYLNIYVDGTLVYSLNQYDPGLVWQKTWVSPNYPAGTHTVRLVHASGVSVDVDALEFLPPDTVAPGAITNLSAATGTVDGSVDLTWTAPGDDGNIGTATSYLVRYGFSPINDQTAWDNATTFDNTLVPQGAGSTEQLTVDGLEPGQTYYFSVRAQDEEPNLGGLSNSNASAVAKAPPPPSNDSIDTPDVISGLPYTVASLNVNSATTDVNDPYLTQCQTNQGKLSVWYSFTPTSSGVIQVDTFGSTYDTMLAVWTDTLSLVACNDDANDKYTSRVLADLQANQKYYIEVIQFSKAAGSPIKSESPEKAGSLVTNTLVLHVQSSPITYVNLGTFDDADPHWTYSGSWPFATATGPYAGTLHYTATLGNSALIYFSGPAKFTLTYTGYSTRGIMDIYVDGNTVTSLNQYDPGLVWQKTWSSPAYPPGIHSVRVVHASGVSVDIDAIMVSIPDASPPAAITNLSAASGTVNGTVDLSWTAPGDDGSTGTVTSYLVRYSSSPISDQTAWDNATAFANTLVPQVAGSTEQLTVDGLTPGQTYYFSVRAQDEEPNLGGLSNSNASAVAKAPAPVGYGIYDDADGHWEYTGNWTSANTTGPYDGTLHYSTSLGNSAEITFNGPAKFVITYTGYFTRGYLDVYVDGIKVHSLNQFNLSLAWQKTWTSASYLTGAHTVRLVHASGVSVDIDAITIQSTVPDVIAPAAITNLGASTGTANGTVNLTWTAPGDDGNTGAATSYLVRYSTSSISDQLTWDNATVFANTLVPKAAGSGETLTVTGLVPGLTYYFAVRAQDEVLNPGGLSNSPSAVAKSPPPVGVGKYDDTDSSAWNFSTGWNNYSGAGPFNNTMHYSTTPGSYAEVTFSGTQIVLTYVKNVDRGLIDVYIDGVKVGTINAYGSLTWQATWTSLTYPNGTHTVRFVHAGASGKYVDMDAIQVIGP